MQDDKQPINRPTVAGSLVPDIVKEIPVAMPATKSQPANEDDELDMIMKDVSQDIRQIGKKKPKHHWFSRPKKTKAEPKFSAGPVEPPRPAPAAATEPLNPVTPPAPVQLAKPPAPATATAIPKPAKTSSAPVGAILLALLVTGALSAAAYFAYK